MTRLALLLGATALGCAPACAQPYPSPTYSSVTTSLLDGTRFVGGLVGGCSTPADGVAINAAIAAASSVVASYELVIPPGCYGTASPILSPGSPSWTTANNKAVRVRGAGPGVTEIRALSTMAALWLKTSDYAEHGGLSGVTLNGNGLATIVFDHQKGDEFTYRDLMIENAAPGGIVARLGAPDGNGGFYSTGETTLDHIKLLGADPYFFPASAMPAIGLQVNSTDNSFTVIVGSNVATSVFDETGQAAGNRYVDIHAYGYGASPSVAAWEPQFCFRAGGYLSTYVAMQCDGASVAGAQISNWQVGFGGTFQWTAVAAGPTTKGIEIVGGAGLLALHGNRFEGISFANAIVATAAGGGNQVSGNPGATYTAP